jgi:hypothetical protein
MFKIIKLYEVFVDSLPKLTYIMDQLSQRVEFWFKNEDSGLNKVNFIEISRDHMENSPTQSIWFIFNDDNFLYKIIITMSIQSLEHCKLVIYKYKSGDEFNLYPSKYEEDNIEVNDIKEDFILNKISKMGDISENPDENRIDTKEPEQLKVDDNQIDKENQQSNQEDTLEEEF